MQDRQALASAVYGVAKSWTRLNNPKAIPGSIPVRNSRLGPCLPPTSQVTAESPHTEASLRMRPRRARWWWRGGRGRASSRTIHRVLSSASWEAAPRVPGPLQGHRGAGPPCPRVPGPQQQPQRNSSGSGCGQPCLRAGGDIGKSAWPSEHALRGPALLASKPSVRVSHRRVVELT